MISVWREAHQVSQYSLKDRVDRFEHPVIAIPTSQMYREDYKEGQPRIEVFPCKNPSKSNAMEATKPMQEHNKEQDSQPSEMLPQSEGVVPQSNPSPEPPLVSQLEKQVMNDVADYYW